MISRIISALLLIISVFYYILQSIIIRNHPDLSSGILFFISLITPFLSFFGLLFGNYIFPLLAFILMTISGIIIQYNREKNIK